MPTIDEIARLSGLSRSTVSRVLNESPRVSEESRERVREIIRQENYHPSLAARGLALGRTEVIGTIIPVGVATAFTNPVFPMLIEGISSVCSSSGRLMLLWLADRENEERMMPKILRGGVVDGVIVTSHVIHDRLLPALGESGKPFVLIGRHPTDDSVSYIDVDNRTSARTATGHLLRLGRRRVATITGPRNMMAGLDRYEGYVEALRDFGSSPEPQLVTEGDFTERSGYTAMRRLLDANPDAVFAGNDSMAVGALRALQEEGIEVPEDIALVGFDDIPAAAHVQPSLTTVRQPIQRLGGLAAEILIELINNPSHAGRRVVLSTELIVRASCGWSLHRRNKGRKEE